MARLSLVWFDLHTGYSLSFNHGLAYLIGALKRAGNQVSFLHIIDEHDFDKTLNSLKSEAPDVVGLSFVTNQKKYVRDFLNTSRLSPRLIIAGGAHATLAKDGIFEDFPMIQGICIGEGEIPLVELCQRLDKNEDYHSIQSFYFRAHDGITKNPISPLPYIDTLTLPDYTLFEYEKIIEDNGGSFPMLISRGCPYSCYYCCNHRFREIYPNKHEYVRFPSVRRAIDIIKSNLSLYPYAKRILFNDDILVLNKKWLYDFCSAYSKEIGVPFRCNARAESITDDVVKCLKRAGCLSIAFGIESGDEWLRTHILNRTYSNKEIKEAFRVTRQNGLKTFSYNMVGLPFETKRMAEDTLNFNIACRPDFGKCFYFYPFPGTVANQLCKTYDLSLNNLETASGILDKPSIKETFNTHKNMIKYFEKLNVLFYSRLLFSKAHMPALFERWLLKIIFLFRKPILTLFDPDSDIVTIKALRRLLRKFALRYIR